VVRRRGPPSRGTGDAILGAGLAGASFHSEQEADVDLPGDVQKPSFCLADFSLSPILAPVVETMLVLEAQPSAPLPDSVGTLLG